MGGGGGDRAKPKKNLEKIFPGIVQKKFVAWKISLKISLKKISSHQMRKKISSIDVQKNILPLRKSPPPSLFKWSVPKKVFD